MTREAPAIFVALEHSGFAAAIRQSPWLYPAANVGHIARAFALNANHFSSQSSPEFSTIQDALKYLACGLGYGPIPDAVHNGRRHDNVTLLGMWWSATVLVLRL